MTAGRTVVGQSRDWGTPRKYVDAVREVFGGVIHLDPCSNEHSIVDALVEYALPEHDGLKDSWDFATIYVNPPYGSDPEHGRTISDWLRRCAEANRLYGAEVLALVPVATNTGHWKKYVFGRASAISVLYATRLRFLVDGKDGGKGAPMSCAMVYWGEQASRFSDIFMRFGAVVDIQKLKGLRIGHAQRADAQLELAEFI
jgi:hypothetical protein